MVNAFLVTNLTEGLPHDVKERYLQNIQQAAGKYNFRIVGAVVDHSEGEFPFFNEVLELVGDVISSGQCDAIILDDTYNYETTESFEKLTELTDSYNTAIFHYDDGDIYMGDPNEDFDYDEEPFEVFELSVDDESDKGWHESFTEGIVAICDDFKERLSNMPPCVRHREMHSFVNGMIGAAEVLIDEATKMQEQMMSEVEAVNKRKKN